MLAARGTIAADRAGKVRPWPTTMFGSGPLAARMQVRNCQRTVREQFVYSCLDGDHHGLTELGEEHQGIFAHPPASGDRYLGSRGENGSLYIAKGTVSSMSCSMVISVSVIVAGAVT